MDVGPGGTETSVYSTQRVLLNPRESKVLYKYLLRNPQSQYQMYRGARDSDMNVVHIRAKHNRLGP